MTDQETPVLAERLVDLSKDVRFVPTFEATYGAVLDQGSRDYIMLDAPQDRGDGTYWIEAGETCGRVVWSRRHVRPRRA